MSFSTWPGSHTSHRSIGAPSSTGIEERAEHADEVADGGGGELAPAVGRIVVQQLAGLEAQRLMAVDDTLRVAGGAGGERDQRRAAGSAATVPAIGSSASRSVEGQRTVGPTSPTIRHVGAQVRLERHAAELARW